MVIWLCVYFLGTVQGLRVRAGIRLFVVQGLRMDAGTHDSDGKIRLHVVHV